MAVGIKRAFGFRGPLGALFCGMYMYLFMFLCLFLEIYMTATANQILYLASFRAFRAQLH